MRTATIPPSLQSIMEHGFKENVLTSSIPLLILDPITNSCPSPSHFIADLMNFQYFISVVPTDVQTTSGFTYNTFQYSVKDQVRFGLCIEITQPRFQPST